MKERALQSEIISWLKREGFYVIKPKPGPGVPVGCPDIIGLHRIGWVAIEVKASPTAKFQPGQELTLKRLTAMGHYVFVVHPENWQDVRFKLFTLLCLS